MARKSKSTRRSTRLAINTIRFLAVDMVEKRAIRASRGAAGPGAARLSPLDALHAPQPGQPRLAEPRPLRPLLRPRLGAALLAPPSRRLRPADRGAASASASSARKTPGHPEHELTRGVETTTGPLGQGIGNAVGMAIAERMCAARFNRDGFPLFDYRIWVDRQRRRHDGGGAATRPASLAGHLKLGQLKVFYDDNKVSIDGPTSLAFSEDVGKRFEAYGWHVLRVDGRQRPRRLWRRPSRRPRPRASGRRW